MGTGMSLVMTDVGSWIGLTDGLVPGIIIGVAGLAMAVLIWPIRKGILAARNTDRNDLTLVDHVIIVDGASGIGEHASESVIHTLCDILFFGEIDFIFLIYRIIIPQFSAFGKRIGTGFVFVTKNSRFLHFLCIAILYKVIGSCYNGRTYHSIDPNEVFP